MTELQQKQLALLEETAAFYNSDKRCVQKDRFTCYYYIEGKDGCAIGRKIADKELCEKLNLFYANGDSGVTNDDVFKLLPIELRELGQEFLDKVQRLHDTEHYWDENGVTIKGKEFVEEVKKEFDLNGKD